MKAPMSQDDQPTDEQIEALQRFANTHGRTWKSKLVDAWISGRDEHMPDGGLLRQVRNQLGPCWLKKAVLPTPSVEHA